MHTQSCAGRNVADDTSSSAPRCPPRKHSMSPLLELHALLLLLLLMLLRLQYLLSLLHLHLLHLLRLLLLKSHRHVRVHARQPVGHAAPLLLLLLLLLNLLLGGLLAHLSLLNRHVVHLSLASAHGLQSCSLGLLIHLLDLTWLEHTCVATILSGGLSQETLLIGVHGGLVQLLCYRIHLRSLLLSVWHGTAHHLGLLRLGLGSQHSLLLLGMGQLRGLLLGRHLAWCR